VSPVLLGAARVLPVALLGPAFGGRSWIARLLVGGLMVAVVWPAVAPAAASAGAVALFHEVLVGLALGLVAAIPFRALEAAGALQDAARTDGGGPFGEAWGLFALALFAALGGPLAVARALGESYLAVPPGAPLGAGGVQVAIEAGVRLVVSAAALAAPALAALLLVEIVAALVVRAQPLADEVVGRASVRTLILVVVLALSASTLAARAVGDLRALPERLGESARQVIK
jgi:flagellar biosynthetic protein FliR